jgi:ribokinase
VKIVVTGYASLDYAVRLDAAPAPDRTSTITSRPREWPRLGGSPAYVAASLVAGGVRDAAPVSWVGDDADGAVYRAGLKRQGVRDDGVSARRGRTPICVLAYEPGGGCHCFYDPGVPESLDFDAAQRNLIAAADCLCITVGPPDATRTALALARPDARLVWAVKADPRAVPPDLATALASRAEIVVHSRGEAPFVGAAFAGVESGRRDGVRVETRGRGGVAVTQGANTEFYPVDPIETEDSTGAGDTFLGGFLAAYVVRGETAAEAVRAGVASVSALLAARLESERG